MNGQQGRAPHCMTELMAYPMYLDRRTLERNTVGGEEGKKVSRDPEGNSGIVNLRNKKNPRKSLCPRKEQGQRIEEFKRKGVAQ